MHFYQFNIGDYISHTSHLTDAEDLAYRRMLDLYYQTELPFDEINKEKIARKVRSTLEIVEIILSEFFEYSIDDCAWHNKRADSEIKSYKSKSDSAKKANEIRWGMRKESVSDMNSDTDQILNIKQETINNKHIKDIRPDDVDVSVWEDFLKHRKLKKAVVTETVLKTIRTESVKANIPLQTVLELMCSRGWTGFKSEWVKDEAIAKPVGKQLKYWEKGYSA